jgi:hypothetical protein
VQRYYGVSSIEPNDGGGELDRGDEVASGFVVACGDGSELLELGEEVFNQVARRVEVTVIASRLCSVRLGRDDNRFAGRDQRLNHPFIGVERLVGDQRIGLHRWQEMVGANEIMGLSAGQKEVDRIAESIDQGMDLGAQSTARAANRLVLAGFFCAPALC